MRPGGPWRLYVCLATCAAKAGVYVPISVLLFEPGVEEKGTRNQSTPQQRERGGRSHDNKDHKNY